jgi:hypothetical protein
LAAKNIKIWIPKRVGSGQTCLDSRVGLSLDLFVIPASQGIAATAPPSPVLNHPPPPLLSSLFLSPTMEKFELDPTR